MSLEHEEQMIDRLSSQPAKSLSAEEKKLQEAIEEKSKLMIKQNKQYLDDLFKEQTTTPINNSGVEVTNTHRFRDSFLKSQLDPLLKNKYSTLKSYFENVDKISKSFAKLNIVDQIRVSIQPVPKNFFNRSKPHLDLVTVFDIVPVKKFYAKTGTNIGNGEGDGYIQFQFKNIFGGGENFTFDATSGTKTRSSYLANYNQPIFNNSNYILENMLYVNTRKLEWIASEVLSTGFTNKLYTQYGTPLNHEIILENSWRELSNLNSRATDVLIQSGTNIKSSLVYNIKFDTRDNSHSPFNGRYFRFGLEYNGLFKFNSLPFIKAVFESQFARSLSEQHSLLLTNKSGFLYPLSQTAHILDRFFIGGPNDVRSFVQNGLGANQYNSSLGGDVFINGGLSLVSKIPRIDKESNFKLHSFVNWGKLIPLDKEISVVELVKTMSRDYSVSIGFGILYNHPMARFELNLVLPVMMHDRENVRKGLQYGIGMSFL